MRTHAPDPRQKTLTVDPGQQRDLIRRVSLGGPTRKAMLFALDSHIGGQNTSWSLTYAELGQEIDVSEPTAYRVARELETIGVIRRESQGARRARFSICWGVLRALDEEQSQPAEDAEPVGETASDIIADDNPILTSDNPVITSENPILTSDNHIRKSALTQHTESPLLAQPAEEKADGSEWALEKKDLKDAAKLFAFAARRGVPTAPGHHDNRRRVLMAAYLALRGTNPPGLFVHLIRKGVRGDWSTLSDEDHEPAKQWLRSLDLSPDSWPIESRNPILTLALDAVGGRA